MIKLQKRREAASVATPPLHASQTTLIINALAGESLRPGAMKVVLLGAAWVRADPIIGGSPIWELSVHSVS